ncbi:YciI family protein [Orbus sturtevantii]|uniref:YciI family protein n=1 Tax=Orbus sturtevantii TaxID=3074109 RepID=UPI00370D7614
MFIITLTYQQPLDKVEQYLPAHRDYLDEHYASGHFIASGPQEPRIGGVILCRAESKAQVIDIIQADPFSLHHIANYEIIEFIPAKYVAGFDAFI